MIALKIDANLTCEKVCKLIQSMINDIDGTNKLLVIDIREITQETNDLILKLEYHE